MSDNGELERLPRLIERAATALKLRKLVESAYDDEQS
jgi:hypothetical protein